MEVIDAHQHVGVMAGINGMDRDQDTVQLEADRRTRAMDDIGISWAVIQPTQLYLRPNGIADTRAVNDGVAALRRRAPDRFRLALGTVDPLHGAASVDEIERCVVELGLHGISWHNKFQGAYIDSPLMVPSLQKLRELTRFAAIHIASGSTLEAPWKLVHMARRFPEITFLAVDGFHAPDEAEHALELASTAPNVLWDLGGPVAPWPIFWELIERFVNEHGAERLTYSADYLGQGRHSLESPKVRSALYERIVESSLSEADKTLILGGNIRRELGRLLWSGAPEGTPLQSSS